MEPKGEQVPNQDEPELKSPQELETPEMPEEQAQIPAGPQEPEFEDIEEDQLIQRYGWNDRNPNIRTLDEFNQQYRRFEKAHEGLKGDLEYAKRAAAAFGYTNLKDFADFVNQAKRDNYVPPPFGGPGPGAPPPVPPEQYPGYGEYPGPEQQRPQVTPQVWRQALDGIAEGIRERMGVDKFDKRLGRIEENDAWRDFRSDDTGKPWSNSRRVLDEVLERIPSLKNEEGNMYAAAAAYYLATNPGAINEVAKAISQDDIRKLKIRKKRGFSEAPDKTVAKKPQPPPGEINMDMDKEEIIRRTLAGIDPEEFAY
jgi:hypothetical protein